MKILRKGLWILTLMALVLCACGPSQAELDSTATKVAADIFATQTAEAPTATFTPEPTDTPTPTELPPAAPALPGDVQIDTSGLTLTVEDFPPGFIELPPDQLGFDAEAISDENFVVMTTFAFANFEPLEIAFGFTQLLSTQDQFGVDLLIENSDMFLVGFVQGLDADVVSGPTELPPIEGLGDASVGLTLVAESEALDQVQIDIMIVRRGIIATYLFVLYPAGEQSIASIEEIAVLMDERMIAAAP